MQSAMNFTGKTPGLGRAAGPPRRPVPSYNSPAMSAPSHRITPSRLAAGLLAAGLLSASLGAALASAAPSPAAAPQPDQAPPAQAQKKGREVLGTIKGTIFGAGRKPRVGLLVQLYSRVQEGLLRVTGTDEKGEYAFQDLPPGFYDIEVDGGPGGVQKKSRIEVRPPFRNIVDFEIPPGDRTGAGPAGAGDLPRGLKRGPGTQPSVPDGLVPDGGGARPMAAVRGRFLDQQKRPIPEVSVTFVALEGDATFQAFSGDDGGFSIPAVPAGRYRVLVASPGHVSLDLKAVEVSAGDGLNLSLSLVDHPLNFKGRDASPPREEPRPLPAETPATAPSS
jgi:hypothetical protein